MVRGRPPQAQSGDPSTAVPHADGFGTPPQKFERYDLLLGDRPVQYGGFKLFYDQDRPLLSPRRVLDRLEPNPAVVSCQ